jgi:putative molybdopterin biosynthesis protein
MYDLGFLPFADEHYDFFLADDRREKPAVQAFIAALSSEDVREALAKLGFTPAADAPSRAAE